MENEFTIKDTKEGIEDIYYNIILKLKGVSRNKDVAVFLKLYWLSDDKGNFNLTSGTRSLICTALGMNKPNLSACLKRLIDLRIIEGKKGDYLIPKDLFLSKKDRDKLEVKLIIKK